ncbi:MAG TPA: SDR family oxidoreductase [Pseudonocardiaceae bacterium]|jgi:NAD(P)-dependent dehydrogenase (short-subunit alcohol dehydrogenase family)|nr:SDR family oxidoreductase [Pseudonocardiaceae bacterium]
MDLRLAGKRAVITGASRGIGLAVADVLAGEGADVVLVARDQTALDAAAERVSRHGGRVLAVAADTTDDTAVRAMVDRAVEQWGGVDILVNAAARPGDPTAGSTLLELADDDLRVEIETKVLGYLRCIRAVAPHMIAQKWGRIINISGLGARQTGRMFGSVRNVAVAAMTKNLADELGRDGINVTVVHPGLTGTERIAGVVERLAAEQGVSTEEVEARIGGDNTIGRIVTAAEVADVVAFLASPRSVAITGDAVAVGGGAPGAIYY